MKMILIVFFLSTIVFCGFSQISGPTTVCAGSTYHYTYNGPPMTEAYWNCNRGGSVVSYDADEAYVQWIYATTAELAIMDLWDFSNYSYITVNIVNCGASIDTRNELIAEKKITTEETVITTAADNSIDSGQGF